MPEFTTTRVVVRLNESVSWNARAENVLFLSRSGARSSEAVPEKFKSRMSQAGNSLNFLRAMEQPNSDNLLGIDRGVQANIVEARIYVIYNAGAFQWSNPAMNSWKQSPIVQALGIEYVQQNRTLSHEER
jgi:hypothetical protein